MIVDAFTQGIELTERAEDRVDIAVVGDVLPEIGDRRGVERGEPDRIDAECRQIRQACLESGLIADPIGAAILKRAGIDLVDHARLPPRPRRGYAHDCRNDDAP